MQNFNIESPVKKINFAVGKENMPASFEPVIEAQKPVVEEIKTVAVAKTIKPEEADEPLLQENPNRFVLFPIKYHEVCRDPNA